MLAESEALLLVLSVQRFTDLFFDMPVVRGVMTEQMGKSIYLAELWIEDWGLVARSSSIQHLVSSIENKVSSDQHPEQRSET